MKSVVRFASKADATIGLQSARSVVFSRVARKQSESENEKLRMKKEFVLDPLNGVGPIPLGASREAVLTSLGTPEETFYKTSSSRYPTDAWFQNGLQVFYEGDTPTVAFVELTNDPDVEAVLFGLPVCATPVPNLIAEVMRHATLDEADPELGYAYTFPSLELAFWRPDEDDAECPYFATVGIGIPGYFSE